MAITCFIDIDAIGKLVAFNLFWEVLSVLDINISDLRVLESAKPRFKKNKDMRKLYGAEVCDTAIAILEACQTVPAEEIEEFHNIKLEKLDPGERFLISAAIQEGAFLFTTGDKNCLQALANEPSLENIAKQLQGRTICVEQFIYKLIELEGFAWVQSRILAAPECDKAIKIAFGWSEPVSESVALENLQSYINDVQLRSQGLLAKL
ncbi:MAG: hypothetical protein ACK53E_23560 [Pseudanabaena sp.]